MGSFEGCVDGSIDEGSNVVVAGVGGRIVVVVVVVEIIEGSIEGSNVGSSV